MAAQILQIKQLTNTVVIDANFCIGNKEYNLVYALTSMCIKLCILSTLPSSVKKIHKQITRVGFEPTTFALLEQKSYHLTTELARWLEAV